MRGKSKDRGKRTEAGATDGQDCDHDAGSIKRSAREVSSDHDQWIKFTVTLDVFGQWHLSRRGLKSRVVTSQRTAQRVATPWKMDEQRLSKEL